MTTRDDLIEYGEKHGWVSAEHRTPESIRLVRPGRLFNLCQIDVRFRDVAGTRIAQVIAEDRMRPMVAVKEIQGGVPAVKRYLREHGVR